MKYTKIPESVAADIQLNAGILLSSFTPSTAAVTLDNIIGATSGGVNFDATPSYSDWGDDIDNAPKNVKEFKKLDSWEVKMSGTFITMSTAAAKRMIGAADIGTTDATKVTPRNDILAADFQDIWWVGDYSDKNGETGGGFIAIHMLNSLSTGGFKMQSGDRSKGQFSFEFTGHYSIASQDTVPFEIYIKAGTSAT